VKTDYVPTTWGILSPFDASIMYPRSPFMGGYFKPPIQLVKFVFCFVFLPVIPIMSMLSEKKHDVVYEKESSLEQGRTEHVVRADDRYHFDAADLDHVQRRLKQRHVQMYVLLYRSSYPTSEFLTSF
jgi:hypothetical protein